MLFLASVSNYRRERYLENYLCIVVEAPLDMARVSSR